MPAVPRLPVIPNEYQDIINYLQSKKIPEHISDSTTKYNFERQCKKFELDENGVLYISAVLKNNEVISDKCRVVPIYDVELHTNQTNEIEIDTLDTNTDTFQTNTDNSEDVSVNNTLGKYYTKLCQQGSVHRKKTANNTIEPGTAVNIAPDHDTNPQTRKRKLQPTFSERGIFKRLTSNNHTAIVEVDGKDISVPIKRVKVTKS
ncbi:5150_t:CDS:2 [Cetraspora pellucida]|uniref:5150_t:CDS:1 n=1 Tax=Cetraspora pellucida TaxID=1433469 RepID=A0ACA9MMV9_9GLOM|nr:5150_t:CDS:2 [Cetraspora pellucida]